MNGQLTQTNCDEAGDYVVPNVLCPRDLVSRPDNMDETVLSSSDIARFVAKWGLKGQYCKLCHFVILTARCLT